MHFFPQSSLLNAIFIKGWSLWIMSEFMVIYEEESGKFFFSSQHFEVLEVQQFPVISKAVVLSGCACWVCFHFLRGIWQFLGILCLSQLWGVGVTCAACVEQVEARYAADHPATHKTAHSRGVSSPNPAALSTESRGEQKVTGFEREDRVREITLHWF